MAEIPASVLAANPGGTFEGGEGGPVKASQVTTVTIAFDGILSAMHTDVQMCLETLDDHEHEINGWFPMGW